MRKNQEIAYPDSCLNRALPEELLFVLIGRDPVASEVVNYWIALRLARGLNKPHDSQITEAKNLAARMALENSALRQSLKMQPEGPELIDGGVPEYGS